MAFRACVSAILLSALTTAAAAPPPQLPTVRVFAKIAGEPRPNGQGDTTNVRKMVTGDVLPASSLLMLWYVSKPCDLPLANASDMLSYAQNTAFGRGCWYPTLDGGYTTVLSNGMTQHSPMPVESFPRGTLNADRSVTITEPGYDSDTFQEKVVADHVRRRMKSLTDGSSNPLATHP